MPATDQDMSKKESSSETDANQEIVVIDTEDAVEFDSGDDTQGETSADAAAESPSEPEAETEPESEL